MALDDPYSDPSLGAPQPYNAWDWVPPSWNSDGGADDEEMRRQLAIEPSPDAPVTAPEQAPAPEFVPPPPEPTPAPEPEPAQPATPPEPLPQDAAVTTSTPEPTPAPEAAPPPPPVDVLATPAPADVAPMAPPLADVAPAPAPALAAPVEPAQPIAPVTPQTAEPQIDALSGAGNTQQPTPPTLLPEQHYAQTAQEYAAHPLDIPDPAERQKFLNDLRQRDPAAFAELDYQNKLANERALGARRAEIATKDHDQQIKNLDAYVEADKLTRAKSEQVWSDAQKIADTKIDPSGGITTGERIAGILMAVIGGYLQGKTGSARNIGLDALNDKINRGIEAQKAELANKRESVGIRKGALAEEYARHGDMYRAQETVRLAALKYADNELATQQQNYAVGGTTELRIAGLRGDVQGQMATTRRAMERQDFDDNLKRIKVNQEQQQINETMRQHRDESARGWAGLASAKADRQAAADARLADKATERADKEQERQRQFALGAPGRIEITPDGKPVVGPDGKPVVKYGDFINADGKPWLVSDPQERAKIGNQIEVTTELNQIYGRIRDIRDRSGGASATLNSDDFQELEQLGKRAQVLTKKGTQGMSSDEDMKALETVAGVKDITSFRDQTKRLEVAQSRTNAAMDAAMRTARYTGPTVLFAGSGPTTKNTPEEDKQQSLLQRSGVSRDQAIAQEFQRRTAGWGSAVEAPRAPDGSYVGGSPLSESAKQAYRDAVAAVDAGWSPGADLDQRAEIMRLGSVARGTGPEATAAKETLAKIASDAHVHKLAELAKQQLAPPAAEPGTYGQSRPDQGQPAIDPLLQSEPGVSRRGP